MAGCALLLPWLLLVVAWLAGAWMVAGCFWLPLLAILVVCYLADGGLLLGAT